MAQEVSIARLRLRRVLRVARLFGLVQSIVIVLLLVWMSEEYNHNQFFQAWTEARLGILSFILNGTLAAFYTGLVITYYLGVPKEKSKPLIEKKENVLAEAQARSYSIK